MNFSLIAKEGPRNQVSDVNKSEVIQHVYKICPQCQTHQECLCNGFHLHIRPVNHSITTVIGQPNTLRVNQNQQYSKTEEPISILKVEQLKILILVGG